MEFDDFVLHIDGYLCEVKDAAIRDGLHILGAAPGGEPLLNLVLVILRSRQLWCTRGGALPGLRAALGLTRSVGDAPPAPTRRLRETARALIEALAAADWDPSRAAEVAARVLGAPAAPRRRRSRRTPHTPGAPKAPSAPPAPWPQAPLAPPSPPLLCLRRRPGARVRLRGGRAPAARDHRRDRRRAARA